MTVRLRTRFGILRLYHGPSYFLPETGFFFAGFSAFGSGRAARILRSASSNVCGASVNALPAFPAGLGVLSHSLPLTTSIDGRSLFTLSLAPYDRHHHRRTGKMDTNPKRN